MTKKKVIAPLNADQIETLDALITAQSSFDDCLIQCIAAGILSSMFDAKHDAFTLVQGRYAARLTADEMQLFLSTDKASKGSPKYQVMEKVNASMRRAKNALADIERVAAATGQDKATVAKDKASAKASAKSGAKDATRSFHDIQMDRIQAVYNAAKKNQVSDAPATFDHAAAFTLLHSLADLFGQKLKEPTTAK